MKFNWHSKLDLLHNGWWKSITVEPSIAIFHITTVMSNQLFINLYLQKSCRFDTSTEPDLQTPCDDEKAGQLFVTYINSWRYSISMTLMIIFTVFATSWSDKAGRRRRPLIIIPLIGLVLVTAVGSAFSYFWNSSAKITAIMECVVHGFTGGRLTVVFAAQLYICDITDEKNRTTRLGITQGIVIIAIPIGNAIIGYMMRYLGFFNSFVICFGLSIIAVILAFLLMKDISVPVENKVSFWRTLSPTRVYESFKIIFKRRPYSRRIIIVSLLAIEALTLLPIIGESSVLYLYLRLRFKMNEKDYGLYSFYKMTLIFIGTMFSTSVLSKYFKIHDAIIGSFSAVCNVLAAAFFVFASNTWQIYTAPVVDMFHGTSIVAVSLISKCLEKHETGHLMSVRSISQILTPLCFPIYNFVYRNTMDFFPSAFFIVSIVITMPTMVLFGLAYYYHTRTRTMAITT